MGFELGTAVRGAGSADVPVLWRTAPVAARLADTHPQERFLVVQPDDYRRAFRAPYRRGGRLLDERALRGFLHHLHFPGHCFDGCGRQDNGQAFHCRMQVLGDISYPVYITHYPLVYIYTAWAFNHQATLAEGLPYMLLTFVGAFALAYACLKFYDLPVRKWLTERF